MLINSNEYLHILESIKQEIRTAQYRAAVSVNRELLLLYHSIGEVINAHKTWGSKFVEILPPISSFPSQMPPATR
ncbi:MAG: hypothetical protein V8T09_07420 [Oscillospiraceae bacterium]